VDGPTIVILEAPLFKVIFDPATRLTLPLVPLRVNPAPPVGDGPIIVIAGLVESWLNVMFEPATRANADEDAVLTVPLVAPPAALVIDTKVE